MEKFTFDMQCGKPVEQNLVLDHASKSTILVYPIISFRDRAQEIRNIIDSIVVDGEYVAHSYHLAMYYQLIRHYTDIEFPEVELEQGENESDEDFGVRKQNAALTTIFEFITRTNIVDILKSTIVDYDDLMKEIEHGVDYAKECSAKHTAWDGLGIKLSDFISNASDVIANSDLQTLLSTLGVNLDENENESVETPVVKKLDD